MRNIFEINRPVDRKRLDIKSENKHLLVNNVCFSKHIIPDKKNVIHGIGEGLISIRELYYDYTVSLFDLGNISLSKSRKPSEILKTLSNNNIFTVLISDSLYSGLNSLVSLISKHITTSNRMKITNIFYHDKIEKNGRKNELIVQIIWHIIDRFVNRVKEIMLNNVNGIKKFLINLEQSAKQLSFDYSNITNRWRMKFQKKSEKNLSIIACTEEDYRVAIKQNIPLKWICYQ